MAVNKNALIRYQALDRCFASRGKRYFGEDLEAVNEAESPMAKALARLHELEVVRRIEGVGEVAEVAVEPVEEEE